MFPEMTNQVSISSQLENSGVVSLRCRHWIVLGVEHTEYFSPKDGVQKERGRLQT